MPDPGGSGNRWEPTDSEPVAAESRSDGPSAAETDPVGRGTPGPTEPTVSAPERSRRRQRGLLAGVAAVFLVGGGVGGYALASGGADAAQPDPTGVRVGPGGTAQEGPGGELGGGPRGWDGHRHGNDGDGDGRRQQGRRT